MFQGEEPEQTQMWFQTLQFYTQSLGGWRKRRKGLGNIMIDPNLVIPPATPTSTPVSTPTPNDAEGAAGGAAAPADAVSLAAEALEKETEWRKEQIPISQKTIGLHLTQKLWT